MLRVFVFLELPELFLEPALRLQQQGGMGMAELDEGLAHAHLSVFCSACEMSFCKSCCFLMRSFFRASIFLSSAANISSSSTC